MNEGYKVTSIDEKWLNKFYDRVTDLFTLSRESLHNTHQWAISLALGFITVILTIDGKENPFPNELGLIIILLSFPLLLRFFIRSCLECAIQYRFMDIRNTMDKYFSASSEKRKEIEPLLLEEINFYYFDFKSPRKLLKIIWDNLRLAYLWIFIVWIGLMTWGFISIKETKIIVIVLITVITFVIFEILSFLSYKNLKYKQLTTK